MSSGEEKKHRKELRQGLKNEARARAEASVPISKSDLKSLFDWLDEKLSDGCEHTNKYTIEFIKMHKLQEEPILRWLAEYGGHCDCEVLSNVENEWG